MELHGDRYYGDDGGCHRWNRYVPWNAGDGDRTQKGKTTKENLKYNFGMPSPEGYRKALRLMKQAEALDVR